MKDLLSKIDIQISRLTASFRAYTVPGDISEDEVIRHFLDYKESKRSITRRIEDLNELRNMAQYEIDKALELALEKALQEEAKEKEKSRVAETKRILKQLSKLDPCSPETALALLDLSNIRR